MSELNRRDLLQAMGATAVVASLPLAAMAATDANRYVGFVLDSQAPLMPPEGITYEWKRASLLIGGELDMENMREQVRKGWSFVKPQIVFDGADLARVPTIADVCRHSGLVLMQKPTKDIERPKSNLSRLGFE